ncbi:MAG TPA: carboxypeptidase-like regulatory domain-containing protein, partial [Pyrinomonadaceae bacterium]|nr:carboxypeptidase-like regulatory domain-containing protein [Pyrinomonadaceae bacterium]
MSTLKNHRSTSLCVLFIVLFLSLPVIAQTITGSISGTVTDASGSVIPGATVTIISDKTNESRNASTNSEGRFNFASVQPGVYTVKIERDGFQTLERTNTVLSANEDLALGELKLQTGQVTGTVVVTSEGQIVERESSDLTARLTSDQINLISTKGRDITSLLRLIPGTSNDDDIEAVGEGFGTNLPNISGQRGRSIVTTIDGLN